MNIKRMRGRGHRPGGNGGNGGNGGIVRQHGGIPLNRNHVFDSSGPDLRLRGTAQQLYEKYLQLGRDASSASDRVMAESYFQHAEHYFRILSAMTQAQGQPPHFPQGGMPRRGGEAESEREEMPPAEPSLPGVGDQPPAEPREIPIAAAPPEG